MKIFIDIDDTICRGSKDLDYSKSEGLSLGKKFKETIEPLGKIDTEDCLKLYKKFAKQLK